jgi:hypothetical protein
LRRGQQAALAVERSATAQEALAVLLRTASRRLLVARTVEGLPGGVLGASTCWPSELDSGDERTPRGLIVGCVGRKLPDSTATGNQ